MEYIERQPVRFIDRELFPHLVNVSRGLADVLGCMPDELLPMPSATYALNTVLRSWQRKCAPTSKDRALCFSVAYGSTKKLLAKLAQESGMQLDVAEIEFPLSGEEEILNALETSLRPETTLVVLDAIPSNAPFLLPLDEAVSLCRRKSPNAFIVIDAAHGLGGTELKLRPAPADALITNCHKWFCGPKGTAVLHVAPAHQAWIEPLVISHGFGADVLSGFYWRGLIDFSSWLALDAALSFWDAVNLGPARIYARYMVLDAAEMLADAWGTGLGIPAELLGPMALVEVPPLPMWNSHDGPFEYEHAEALQNALFDRRIEVPVKALSGRLYVRISAHIYNGIEDYEILRDAVLDLAAGSAN